MNYDDYEWGDKTIEHVNDDVPGCIIPGVLIVILSIIVCVVTHVFS